jgi:Type IV secretory system Conjugative DNA transfer
VQLDFAALLHPRAEFVWREVHWPAELEPDAALAVLRQLATDRLVRLIVFEVEASGGRVVHRVGVAEHAVSRVEQLLAALIPDSALIAAGRRPEVNAAWRVALSTRHRPLQISNPDQIARAVLAALTAVKKDERVVLQWLLGRTHAPRPVAASTPSTAVEPWWHPLVAGSERHLDAERRHALQAKRGDHAFSCLGRVAISAATEGRTRALAVGVLAGLRIAEAPGIGVKLLKESSDRFNRVAVPWHWPEVLNVSELLGVLAWPLGKEPLPGVPRDSSRYLRPDARIGPNGRVLAQASAPDEDRRLGLSIEDARQHLHVIGPTGTGKSTLLANLICQDIAAGRGVVVIEPKGDLVESVLARIPSGRIGDVVVLDPSESEYPVGLNPLLGRGRAPELVADQVLAVFHALYEANWGPRMQDILHASLLTLAGRGDASLCVLPALLTNPAVRRRLRAGVDDPIALEPFWAWFDAISDAERQQAIAPVLNKLRPFLLRRSVRAIVGQIEPRFRIDEVFTHRKVVLCSLAKGLIGPEAAALLGSLLVGELWQAVLGRARIPVERRHPVVVYADEFQDYVHLPTDMADALAQARGLGVALTLAHQHLSQLPGNLRAAVLANARSRVCFQLAGDDAQTMARFSGGVLQPIDFQRLRRYEVYAQLVVGGEVTDFASARTLPLLPPSSEPGLVREASRLRYGRPAADVEAEIRRLVETEPGSEEDDIRPRRRDEGGAS